VRNILIRYGLHGRAARRKPLISKRNQKARRQFAKDQANRQAQDWQRIVFTDETKVNLLASDGRQYVRRSRGEELAPQCMRRTVQGGGGSLMVWGAITADGPGPLVRMEGSVNAANCVAMLQQHYLPYVRRHLTRRHILQQDNAPAHKAAATQTWLQRNRIQVLPWPAQSPDLKPN
jgi:hypothetical protein